MTIDRGEFVRNCVDQALLFGVNPHYLAAIAEVLSGIKDDTSGSRIGPFRPTQQEWDASGSDAEFEITLLPKDINNPDMQCIFAALMTLRAQRRLIGTLGRNPSAGELYAEYPNIPPPSGKSPKEALTEALASTEPLIGPAIDAALEGMEGAAGIDLSSIDLGKRPIALMIINAFAGAGFSRAEQQAAALANAIAESGLNPSAHNTSGEDSIGLFQLNRNGGLGKGHSVAELMDPGKNISIIIGAVEKVGEFKNAKSLEAAVTAFVTKVERPKHPETEIPKRIAIGQKLLRPGVVPGTSGAVTDKLKQQISAGKITFDSPALETQLLGLNTGTKVTPKLQALVLKLSELASPNIRISSLVREGTGSHHTEGRAVDIGNEAIAGALLPIVATDSQVAALEIDELIFDANIAGQSDRNKWNYDQGIKHNFNIATLDQHGNHIHFAVKA